MPKKNPETGTLETTRNGVIRITLLSRSNGKAGLNNVFVSSRQAEFFFRSAGNLVFDQEKFATHDRVCVPETSYV